MKTMGISAALKGALCAVCVSGPTYVAADTRIGARVSADGGYSTNPFGSSSSRGASAATATIRFAPIITVDGERTDLSLNGNVAHTEYSRRYKGKTDYSAGARLNFAISPLTNASLSSSFDSSVSDNNSGILLPFIDPTDPAAGVVVDPSLGSERRLRRKNYRVGGSLSHTLSERDQISLSTSATAVRTSRSVTSRNYNYGSASLAYNRSFSESTSLGLNFQASKSNYLNSPIGDSRTLSPQITASRKLGQGWSLSASGGVSFTRYHQATGVLNYSSPSGSLSLCKADTRWNNCLSASRSVLPSSSNGVGNQTSVSLSSSYRLDEQSRISSTVAYSRSSELGSGGRRVTDYLNTDIGYSRNVSQRLSVNASVGYSDTYRSLVARKPTYNARIGIGYLLGDIR